MNETVNEAGKNEIIKPEVPKRIYKMIALRGVTIFPQQVIHFDLGRDKSVNALNKAVEDGQNIFLVSQKHASTANPAPKDIYRIGTIAKIKQVLKLPGDNIRVLVQGLERAEIESYQSIMPFFVVSVNEVPDEPGDYVAQSAATRKLKEVFDEYLKLDHKIPADVVTNLNVDDIEKFVSAVNTVLNLKDGEKQALLEERIPERRIESLIYYFTNEMEIMKAEKRISAKVRKQIDKNQKEYYLREQLRAIHEELGDGEEELDELLKKAEAAKLPEEVFNKVKKEVNRMSKMSPTSPESGVIRTYVEWILDLPWHESTEDNFDLIRARNILDEDHYSLEKVKDRILEYLAVLQLTKTMKGPILCFVGPPGVGKTSIVRSIAKALGRQFVSMSLGGVRDEAEIRGHRRTYIGAIPGRIVYHIKQAGKVNPLFLFDEIDKMSSDYRGDPASAMLEVLDPEQNFQFKDHYLELPYDLSKVMFITTANTLDTIPAPLLDRMEIIELTGYTNEEKTEIALRHLLPKQLKNHGMDDGKAEITKSAIDMIISRYTRESGVRSLEKEIASICRKIARKIVEGDKSSKFVIDNKNLEEYLGIPKYSNKEMNETDEIGAATGLAWTSVGGTTMTIEVGLIPGGKGEIILTGSLGDVMKESARTALSLIKARAAEYEIDKDFFSTTDIHIHVPEGATPKDGPSAGITMATALLSAITRRPVSRNVAMTGEITLRGKVLPIGGLKEKALACYRSGVRNIILPKDNEKDVQDIPKEIAKELNIIFAEDIGAVFKSALV